jgi:TPR repeat protein
LEESSAKNHPDSMYQLAKCLSKGIGLEMNETKALEYYKSAAKLGHLKSQIYLVSKATTKLEKFEYLKMAADGGDPNSQFLIGNLYAKGIGVTQDFDKAFEYIKKSADHGYSMAQARMGFLLKNSIGCREDLVLSHDYFLKAGNKGDYSSLFVVAWNHFKGVGTPQDLKKAFECFKKCADGGNHHLYPYNVGVCYFNGYGVEKNLKKAFAYFDRAQKKGNPDSKKFMDLICLEIDTLGGIDAIDNSTNNATNIPNNSTS